MKAIDILEQVSNDYNEIKKCFITSYHGYNEILGNNKDNYEVVFHDSKIYTGISVFVTNVRLSKKPNIIMENINKRHDVLYFYKVTI